ncbi:MAG: cation:proton antiporter [Candidatus Krumholzibacteria bacterium]|nr:cation:proton antiporter [Candidatus Krumholzibacteria bacterium]
MHFDLATSPALTVALALAAGIIAQSIARHLRLPGIVILLGVGALLGPDGLGVLRPSALGEATHILVEFAVAVILFEGGLNLEWRRLRAEGVTIRRLVWLGALVTALGGMLVVHWVLGWSWRLSILFGTLVVVTGPTVITPLLRRIKIKRNLETVLEAEGVFIDAVGAILAVVALEVALSPTGSSLAIGFVGVPSRLVFGAIFGLVGGLLIAALLRFRGVVPEGLENVFTLSLALALYQLSVTLVPETGITSVIVAGFVVGNARTPVHRELKEFKEQLTVMLIGMLFVILAADVRLAEVAALGWRGLLVVFGLMVVVRPINVIVCTLGGGMNWREKAFLSWLAPRGIVAAAVASLFYDRMSSEGLAGGAEMRALVFLVIAVTVVFQGSTGAVVAKWLGVRRPSGRGYVILGAHEVGRVVGRLLRDAGEDVVLIDASAEACREAQEEGFRVVFGNALEERVLIMADLESRKGAIGTLPNEAVNLLFVRRARNEYKVPKTYVAIQRGHGAIDAKMVHDAGATVLFAEETDLDLWSVRIRRDSAHIEVWRRDDGAVEDDEDKSIRLSRDVQNLLLPLALLRDGSLSPLDDRTRADSGDEVYWLVLTERAKHWQGWLEQSGWRRVEAPVPAKDS